MKKKIILTILMIMLTRGAIAQERCELFFRFENQWVNQYVNIMQCLNPDCTLVETLHYNYLITPAGLNRTISLPCSVMLEDIIVVPVEQGIQYLSRVIIRPGQNYIYVPYPVGETIICPAV